MTISNAPDLTLQYQGAWTVEELERLCATYHGTKGAFAYCAFAWLNTVLFDGELPVPLLQWALTAWGRCLGYTRSHRTRYR